MHDQPNELDGRVRLLDESVERLNSEVASLKLEVATLVSAIHELQFQHTGLRASAPATIPIDAPSRPSMAPAAIVVAMVAALLSWQLIVTPRQKLNSVQAAHVVGPARAPLPPPLDPLSSKTERVIVAVEPTVYKGTLTVNADRPGARVFVNRRNVGTVPIRVRNLRAGSHLVWVESEGYRRWTRVVTVPAERVTRVSVDLEPIEHAVQN